METSEPLPKLTTDFYRVALIAVVAATGCLLALWMTDFQRRIADSHDRAAQAVEVVNHVRLVDALEWQAIAGEAPADILDMVEQVERDLVQLISTDAADGRGSELASETEAYVDAVTDMLGALEAGDRERALAIDEERVDPRFGRLIELAEEIAESERATAAATERTVKRATWVGVVAAAGTIGGLVWALFGMQLRHRRSRRQAEANQRFRSLVESSQSGIMVVTGHDDVQVMTPTVGPLEPLAPGSRRERVSDVLPLAMYADWASADADLRADGRRRVLELKGELPNGAMTWVEGRGSLMLDAPHDRVWIWQDITAKKQLEQELNHKAFYDPLTGLSNRSLLQDRLEHALLRLSRSARPVTLLFCDLDDFKGLNDQSGHRAGDELLKVVAERIKGSVREGDTVARLGGDEFAVLLEDTDTTYGYLVAERLLAKMSEPVTLGDRVVSPTLSIGIAAAAPELTADQLIHNADLAMYSAKRDGKARAVVFQDLSHDVASELEEIRRELKVATGDTGFSLHFQPMVDFIDGTVEATEAFARWNHPTLGNVAPGTFIPIAEDSGLMYGVGKWILLEACTAAAELQVGRERPIRMHVNLSAKQLHAETIVATVKDCLEQTGLPPELLVLEITEGSLLDDVVARDRLTGLHGLGVLVAIDDFGAGYMSIEEIQKFPVDILKVDRSFVSGGALLVGERVPFLQSIIEQARGADRRCVAEGIEETSQLDELRELGYDSGQGYFWTEPVPLSALRSVIERIEADAPRSFADLTHSARSSGSH